MISRKQILGLSTIFTLTCLAVIISRVLIPKVPTLTSWILVWAGLESLVNFYGINWGLKRSNRAFFSIFFGGTLLRLLSLGILTSILIGLHIPPTIPLISLVAAYFLFSIVQLPFISYGLH
jgi:hypothetical protein